MFALEPNHQWFFNKTTKTLYYWHNATAGTPPPADTEFVATKTKVLINVSGTQQTPVRDFTFRGIEVRDTALTYLGDDPADRHGMPTGGDWALQRSGAIVLEGTERASVDGSYLHHIDGNGIFVSHLTG